MRDIHKIFDSFIGELYRASADETMLDACMELNQKEASRIPLRYRIIALGFVRRMTLDELNEKLLSAGCAKLYVRNLWEALLSYAFLHKMSYSEWKNLQTAFRDLKRIDEGREWFPVGTITWRELETYVLANSEGETDRMVTEAKTASMEAGLERVEGSEELREYLTLNLRFFSTVREKARYYFCKYLYYWLKARIERYFQACSENRGVENALAELSPLKVVTRLRRETKLTEDEKRRMIQESAISCGEIFSEFNWFYFGYVSMDWVGTLLECYGADLRDMPANQKKACADCLRREDKSYAKLSDANVLRLYLEREEETKESRGGETALNRYIRGTLDVDRTVLACFLLFFAGNTPLPSDQKLSEGRMNRILSGCGYRKLDVEDDFDWFLSEMLDSRNPASFVTEVMTEYAEKHENSFLYLLYGSSVSIEEELNKTLV